MKKKSKVYKNCEHKCDVAVERVTGENKSLKQNI